MGNLQDINSRKCGSLYGLGKDEKAGMWISFPGKKEIQILALGPYMCVGWGKLWDQDVVSKAFER